MSVFNRFLKIFRLKALRDRFGKSTATSTVIPSANAPKTLDHQLVYALGGKKIPSTKQLKYLLPMLEPRQRLIVLAAAGMALVGLVAIAVNFFNRNFERVPATGGEYIGGLIGAPQYLNPLLAQNDVDVDLTRLIFSGLMRYDKKLGVVPDLAERYEISSDQKIYTFVIRENARWHDDEPVTAEDVIFTFDSITDSDFRSPLIISLRGVEIDQIDERTVRFTLPQPYPLFLEVLTTGILPEHLWREIPPINATLAEYNIKPIGSGPWMFESFTKDRLGNIKTINLKPHQVHYSSKPYLKHLTFKFYPDFVSAVQALKNHSVDGISFLPKELKPQLASQKGLRFYSFYLPQYTAIFFNQKKLDLLRDKNIRRALALSIDKHRLLTEALEMEGEIIQTPLLPVPVELSKELINNYNTDQADKLFDAAGWKKITSEEYQQIVTQQATTSTSTTSTTPTIMAPADDESEQKFYRKKGNEILTIALTTVNHPVNVKTAELIKKQWEDVGVKVTISVVESNKITREIIKPRNYDVLLFGIIVGTNADPFPFWHSSQAVDPGLNLAQLANREIDQLLENARAASADNTKRGELYTKFASVIAQEIPAIFLYNPTYTYVVDQKIKGLDITRITIPADRFNNISEWYIKQRWQWTGFVSR